MMQQSQWSLNQTMNVWNVEGHYKDHRNRMAQRILDTYMFVTNVEQFTTKLTKKGLPDRRRTRSRTPEALAKHKEIIDYYAKTLNGRLVGDKFGLSRERIRQILKMYGVDQLGKQIRKMKRIPRIHIPRPKTCIDCGQPFTNSRPYHAKQRHGNCYYKHLYQQPYRKAWHKAWHKKYWIKHKEHLLKKNKEYVQAHKEKVQARAQAWRDENRERVRARDRAYYKKNRAKILASIRANSLERRKKKIERILASIH